MEPVPRTRRLIELARHESNVLVLTAVIVGVLTGLGAVVLVASFRVAGELFLGDAEPSTSNLLRVALAPAIGGLIVGPIVTWWAREARGHGVPEVMEAVALRGGRIRGRVAVVKTVASALTIGSGGSAGREGPIVQIGAALGSFVARTFGMREDRARVLVACGAAGGISAAFNAPLAGVFFALEVILQRFTTRGFATVVVSAVTSSVVWRATFGNDPVLDVKLFGLRSPVELLIYVGLGVAAAMVAIGFVRALYLSESLFESLPIRDELKPAVGGLLLGGLGVGIVLVVGEPIVFGSGLLGIDRALNGEYLWYAMLLLVPAKVLATSFTLGSGGSGGVFAPSLFMGAMLGGAVGYGAQLMLPAAQPAAYVMVGMAAVFAGMAQAPISAILILFEMTNDYRIIVPLMLSCIVATVVYSLLQKDSVYTLKLRRRGIVLSEGRERHLLERTSLERALIEDFTALQLPTDLESARRGMRREGQDSLVCVDSHGRFRGIFSIGPEGNGVTDRSVEELLDLDTEPLTIDDTLDTAFDRIGPRGLHMLPVVQDRQSGRVLGIVTRESLASAYWAALAGGDDNRPDAEPGENGWRRGR